MVVNARTLLRRSGKVFLLVAFFSFFLNLLVLTLPIYMMQVFDRVLGSRSEDTLYYLTVVAIGALMVYAALEIVRAKIMGNLAKWFEVSLRRPAIMASIQMETTHAGTDKALAVVNEMGRLQSFLSGRAIFNFLDAPWVPLFLLIIFLIHPILGWIAAGGAVLLFLLAVANDLWTRKHIVSANGMASRLQGRAQAMIRNTEVVESMGMLPHLADRWEQDSDEAIRTRTDAADKANIISAISKFFRFTLQLGVMGMGVWLALQDELTPGAMIAASIILGRALAPVEQLIGSWKDFIRARQSYKLINEVLDNHKPLRGSMTYPAPQGTVTVEGATFYFPRTNVPILRGVSFSLAPGEQLGVVGPSAAGKSTLARLLVGIWRPTAGHVRLDGIDVFTWDRKDFGQYVGYLPQDVELFDGTIRENIARMTEAEDESVITAAKAANAHEMIVRLPQGYDTAIGEGGARLSGGQRQRIGLARALYGDPRLLVLDEPNSNLDSQGEAALIDALKAAKSRGATIIVIAHRPSVLAHVDKMLVLRDGRVEMFGARDEIVPQLTRQGEGGRQQVRGGTPRVTLSGPGGNATPAEQGGKPA